MSKNNGSSFGKKRKPWHIQGAVEQLHKKMKQSVGEWLDAYYTKNAPENILPLLLERKELGLKWLAEEGYRYDHTKIKHISDFSFAMVFDLYKKDVVVNSFDFIVAHDGGFKDPHKIAAMIFVGTAGE